MLYQGKYKVFLINADKFVVLEEKILWPFKSLWVFAAWPLTLHVLLESQIVLLFIFGNNFNALMLLVPSEHINRL